ncbi:MAG: GTPase Era, partial [Gallionellaceae bacterium]|nr:GTPase Era [Gallionellaceae bacterium]
MNDTPPFRSGYIAIVGRPNVGKSTLLNHLVGQKISITSRKAQTTRHRIVGIYTDERSQFAFVDTPGFQTRFKSALNRGMNRAVSGALHEVDAVLFVVEARHFDERDKQVLELLPQTIPVILVINKSDYFADKNEILPFIEKLSKERDFAAIVPVSARQNRQLDTLLDAIRPLLPEGEARY